MFRRCLQSGVYHRASINQASNTMILSTPRLTLRDAADEDAETLVSYQNDPRYSEHYSERSNAKQIIRLTRTQRTSGFTHS